jgi:phosphocarrier protein
VIKTNITICNKLGLHARASAKLTKLASRYQSDVHLTRKERRVNAKSIMGVMMLAAGVGSEIQIEVEGADEAVAIDSLVALINAKFGESE